MQLRVFTLSVILAFVAAHEVSPSDFKLPSWKF